MAEYCPQVCPLVDTWMMEKSKDFRQKVLDCPGPIIKEYRDKVIGRKLGSRTFQCVMMQGPVEHIEAVRPDFPHTARTLTQEEVRAEAEWVPPEPTEHTAEVIDFVGRLNNTTSPEGRE